MAERDHRLVFCLFGPLAIGCGDNWMDNAKLRKDIIGQVRAYARNIEKEKFVPGKTKIHYAGRVYDEEEMALLAESALDFWLTAGRFSEQFEREFAQFFGTKYCAIVNSGSSANLVALSSLTGDLLGKRKLDQGDRVITCASGFPPH